MGSAVVGPPGRLLIISTADPDWNLCNPPILAPSNAPTAPPHVFPLFLQQRDGVKRLRGINVTTTDMSVPGLHKEPGSEPDKSHWSQTRPLEPLTHWRPCSLALVHCTGYTGAALDSTGAAPDSTGAAPDSTGAPLDSTGAAPGSIGATPGSTGAWIPDPDPDHGCDND